MTRIIATSDFHGHLPVIDEPCDLILIAGDICPATNHDPQYQFAWMNVVFAPWLAETKHNTGCKEIVGICGNHDFVGVHYPDDLRRMNWDYLDNQVTEVCGLKIWGCPRTKEFFNWAFMLTENELAAHHANIPTGMDVILTHGPPHGFGDLCQAFKKPRGVMANVGSPALTEYIIQNEPKLVICGHIHCAQSTRKLGRSIIANVSYVDEHYKPFWQPTLFTIEPDGPATGELS
jgi:Icc-related predicted phosphoesterase